MVKEITLSLVFGIACGAFAKPNLVLIYADDLGYTDLSCQGSKFYETPHIDRIAREGMTFTQAYAGAANCAPSRACLMTGQYTPRHGVFTVGNSARGRARNRVLVPIENKATLHPKFITLAEALKSEGYRTCLAGKWHLSEDPRQDGFEVNFGGSGRGNPKSYFSPYKNPALKDGPVGEHLPERLGREVAGWIKANAEAPFFAYVPFYSVHTPIQAPKKWIAKYQKKEGHGSHRNAKYAAMIAAMDEAVGVILKTLDDLKLAENTMVVFTSDNGPHGSFSRAEPLRGVKGMYYEGGIREPFLVRHPGKIVAGARNVTPISQIDLYPTFLELAGVARPERLDGVSLVPALQGKPLPERDLFWHFPGYLQSYQPDADSASRKFRTTPCSVIRRGDWKLIHYFEDGAQELYDLKTDLSEKVNLVKTEPEKARELATALTAWQREVKAPIPTKKNPQYRE
eukprot:snap_masked-scaffold3337_size9153-processed-gene-0.4 protein:Tk00439 transcript:snap_masked-scaffold3337_size9153-processed-gene-0.4-mRNA-1 annotation:"aryl-sulphate sulphohydrolase"